MLLSPMNSTLSLAVTIAALSPLAPAHDRVDVLTGSTGTFGVSVLELDVGGAIRVDDVLLQPITPFPLPVACTCIERVGSEVWVGSNEGVLRYGGTPLTFVGSALVDERIVAISRAPFGAILSTVRTPAGTRSLVDVDGAAVEIARTDTGVRSFTDIDPFQGGFLGAADDVLLRLDASYDVLFEFAPDAASVAMQNGTGYFPERITMLDDGRIAVAAVVSVGILRDDQTVEDVVSVAPFEQDLLESAGGLLLLPSAAGLGLIDPDSFEFFPRQDSLQGFRGRAFGSRYSTVERGSTGRTCTPTPNSTGDAARVHLLVDASAAVRKLSVIATRLPAGVPSLPIHGPAGYDAPFGDGRLCVSPFVPGIVRGPVGLSSATGSVRTDFDFVTPGLGAGFLAGTTWFHQVLFRDSGPSGFDATDGVFVTFEP